MYIYIYIYTYIYVYVYLFIRLFIYFTIYAFIDVFSLLADYLSIYLFNYLFIYLYVAIYCIHNYAYIYIYTHPPITLFVGASAILHTQLSPHFGMHPAQGWYASREILTWWNEHTCNIVVECHWSMDGIWWYVYVCLMKWWRKVGELCWSICICRRMQTMEDKTR